MRGNRGAVEGKTIKKSVKKRAECYDKKLQSVISQLQCLRTCPRRSVSEK
jgi:hypothetical protein